MNDLHIPYAKDGKNFVVPNIANKHTRYTCPECGEEVLLASGSIVRPYFRHFSVNRLASLYISIYIGMQEIPLVFLFHGFDVNYRSLPFIMIILLELPSIPELISIGKYITMNAKKEITHNVCDKAINTS
jgi:hypothetical protein